MRVVRRDNGSYNNFKIANQTAGINASDEDELFRGKALQVVYKSLTKVRPRFFIRPLLAVLLVARIRATKIKLKKSGSYLY